MTKSKINMKIKYRLCELFGHKWTYYELPETNRKARHCKRCNVLQYWKWHMAIWSNAIEYTEIGARKHVEGYEKK